VLYAKCSGLDCFRWVSLPVPFRTCYVANSETGEAFVKIKDHSHEIGVTILNLEHPDGVITLSGENNAVTCDYRMNYPVDT
jgi:hypothetical protein